MEKILCPSTMCLNFENISEEIIKLDKAGADMFHNDIMDGCFVPNITLGLNDLKAIRKSTDTLLDCHLMIENPSEKIDWFINTGMDIIYIHPESDKNTAKILQYLREKGVHPGIAVSPDVTVKEVESLLELCDYILVMTVTPGFAGQKFLDSTRDKIDELIKLKEKYHYKLIMDGACSPAIIEEFSHKGVDGFVLGTSALFGKGRPYSDIMEELRRL